MRVLLDKNVPVQVRRFLRHHTVVTAAEQGWGQLANGLLLDAAEADGVEVFVTSDQNIRHQQDLNKRNVALVVLGTNSWPIIRVNPQPIAQAVDAAAWDGAVDVYN